MNRLSISRRGLLTGAAGVALTAVMPRLGFAATPGRKPNFVVVLCDDLGYGDIGPFGNRQVPTPNLDRMAREGTRLTNYYAPANLCTPSRAGMLTGRYPIRTGLAVGVIQAVDTYGLPRSEVTIANALKSAGYTSALFGKWHLGHQGEYWPPTNYGYDHFYGIPYSHDMTPLAVYESDAGSSDVKQTPVDFHFPGALKVKPGIDDVADYTSNLEEQLYGQAEWFIEAHRDRPFYVQLNLSTPHLPEIPSRSFKGRSDVGPYGDTIEEIDAIVGRLLDKLESLGLAKDTLVIFTSDNGPWYWGSSGGLRDRKGGPAYDGGYRVPFIAWQPGSVPANQKVDSLCCGIDLLPTFCALAGVSTPVGVELDGINIASVLHDGAMIDREVLLFAGAKLAAVRTQRWKYIRLPQYALFGYDELYDMRTDMSESYNLHGVHPDVTKAMGARFDRAEATFKPMEARQHVSALFASVHKD